jgi:hypothetical protein
MFHKSKKSNISDVLSYIITNARLFNFALQGGR